MALLTALIIKTMHFLTLFDLTSTSLVSNIGKIMMFFIVYTTFAFYFSLMSRVAGTDLEKEDFNGMPASFAYLISIFRSSVGDV
jgi:hypothetical protein